MERPTIEVADIFRRYGSAYRDAHSRSMSQAQRRVMRAIEQCRTAALGGHVEQCDRCEYRRIAYNSCANRHCPKCQSLAKAQWLEARRAELLPVEYHHVVFTLPEEIAAIAYQNQAVVYGLFFRAAAETLQMIAGDPKHLGAEIGFIAVLHTWGQTLLYHPHLHCIVPGGGLALDGQSWVSCRAGFFLPVRVLSRLFRRVFLDALHTAFATHQLQFFSSLESLADPQAFAAYLAPLRQTEWVVYAKPPTGGPQQVLDYLSRYTHRVAIANYRLVSIDKGHVSFRWKDYRHHHQSKVMTLSAEEFIRRFLLHVLPTGLQRIRHYGFMSNCHRAEKLMRCRQFLGQPSRLTCLPPLRLDYRLRYELLTGRSLWVCPHCQHGQMVRVECLFPGRDGGTLMPRDTS